MVDDVHAANAEALVILQPLHTPETPLLDTKGMGSAVKVSLATGGHW